MENNTSIEVIEEKIHGMQAMVNETKVTNDAELTEIADKIKNVKNLGKVIVAEKEKYTKPAQEIINNARARFLPYEKECEQAEKQLKAKATEYMVKVEEERRKKEESIVKRVENGNLKEQTGLRKMEELGEEKKTIATETGAKLTLKTVKEVVIIDREKIPHEFWVVDEVKIRKVALSGINIPGVEVKEVKQMSA